MGLAFVLACHVSDVLWNEHLTARISLQAYHEEHLADFPVITFASLADRRIWRDCDGCGCVSMKILSIGKYDSFWATS